MRIYKYPLELVTYQSITASEGAEVLALQVQMGVPTLWLKVDTRIGFEKQIEIYLAGTGQELNNQYDKFLGTVQVVPFVWHFFAKGF